MNPRVAVNRFFQSGDMFPSASPQTCLAWQIQLFQRVLLLCPEERVRQKGLLGGGGGKVNHFLAIQRRIFRASARQEALVFRNSLIILEEKAIETDQKEPSGTTTDERLPPDSRGGR